MWTLYFLNILCLKPVVLPASYMQMLSLPILTLDHNNILVLFVFDGFRNHKMGTTLVINSFKALFLATGRQSTRN